MSLSIPRPLPGRSEPTGQCLRFAEWKAKILTAFHAECLASREHARWTEGSSRVTGPLSRAVADVFQALVEIFMDRTTKQCWPSLDTLAERAGVGYSTAKAAIPVLIKFGWVTRQARYRRVPVRGGYTVVKTSNLYTITIPKRWHRYFARRAKLQLLSLQRYLHGRALQLAAHWSSDWVAAMEDFARRAIGLPDRREAVQAPAERPEPPPVPETPLPAPPHLRGPLPRLPELLVNQIGEDGSHPLIHQMDDTPTEVLAQWQAGLEALRQAATKSTRLTARNRLHAILSAERERRGLPPV